MQNAETPIWEPQLAAEKNDRRCRIPSCQSCRRRRSPICAHSAEECRDSISSQHMEKKGLPLFWQHARVCMRMVWKTSLPCFLQYCVSFVAFHLRVVTTSMTTRAFVRAPFYLSISPRSCIVRAGAAHDHQPTFCLGMNASRVTGSGIPWPAGCKHAAPLHTRSAMTTWWRWRPGSGATSERAGVQNGATVHENAWGP